MPSFNDKQIANIIDHGATGYTKRDLESLVLFLAQDVQHYRAEVERLQDVNKGLVRDVNTLTAENRTLSAEVERLTLLTAELTRNVESTSVQYNRALDGWHACEVAKATAEAEVERLRALTDKWQTEVIRLRAVSANLRDKGGLQAAAHGEGVADAIQRCIEDVKGGK